MPAARLVTVWLNEPVLWRKATWAPSGALGLPAVKPLPLPEIPAEPANAQGVPAGSYWKAPKLPDPTAGDSNPASCRTPAAADVPTRSATTRFATGVPRPVTRS